MVIVVLVPVWWRRRAALSSLHRYTCSHRAAGRLTILSAWLWQLADFGFSKDAGQHSAPSSRVGTPAYLAPEIAKLQPGQEYDGQVRSCSNGLAGTLLVGACSTIVLLLSWFRRVAQRLLQLSWVEWWFWQVSAALAASTAAQPPIILYI